MSFPGDMPDEADAATARLEQALERIAAAARTAPVQARQAHGPAPDTAAMAARLDALIEQVRAALAQHPAAALPAAEQ